MRGRVLEDHQLRTRFKPLGDKDGRCHSVRLSASRWSHASSSIAIGLIKHELGG